MVNHHSERFIIEDIIQDKKFKKFNTNLRQDQYNNIPHNTFTIIDTDSGIHLVLGNEDYESYECRATLSEEEFYELVKNYDHYIYLRL